MLSTLADVLREVPCGGLAYLPTASYREMEGWALPPDPQLRLAALEKELGAERIDGPEGSLVRGSHWRHFLVKYPESNRLQKMMVALSTLCRERGDPAGGAPRRGAGAVQRRVLAWRVRRALPAAPAECACGTSWCGRRRCCAATSRSPGRSSTSTATGPTEIWVHGAHCSIVVAPARGGAIEVLSHFAAGVNYADVLTRRREAYHDEALSRGQADAAHAGDGTASIHDLEQSLRLEARPAIDPHDRAIGVDRLLPADTTAESLEAGTVARGAQLGPRTHELHGADRRTPRCASCWPRPTPHWSRSCASRPTAASRSAGAGRRQPPAGSPANCRSRRPLQAVAEPMAELVTYPIETVAKSEKGFDRTRQGESLTFLWPASQGSAQLIISPAH